MVSGLPYYVWEVPDKKISIQLHYDVIDRMSPDILRGLGALKRRGAEVGGILLGSSEDGAVRTVTIEDFEPVPSEYLTGPSFNLSPNDLVSFEAAIRRAFRFGRCQAGGGLLPQPYARRVVHGQGGSRPGSPLFRRSRKCIPDCEAVHDAPLRGRLFLLGGRRDQPGFELPVVPVSKAGIGRRRASAGASPA